MFPKMDVVTSFLLSQKNIYIYNAAKSSYEYYGTDEDDASVDSWRKYEFPEQQQAIDNNEDDYLFKAASRFVIALINDPWFIFFIMSYKFTYGKEVRVTQFKCPCYKLDTYFDFQLANISQRLYDLMNLAFHSDKMVDWRGEKKNKKNHFIM